MLFTGSFIRFTLYWQAPLFDLHENLQAPLFDLHDIYRLLYSIYMVFTGSFILFTWKFTGSLIWFTWYLQAPLFDLQAPLFDLHGIYRLLYLIYMKIYRLLHSICMKFTGSLKPFACYLQVTFSRFTCYLHGLCPLVWEIYRIVFIIYMFHLKYLHVFYRNISKHVNGKKYGNYHLQYLFDDLHVIYMFFYILCKFSTFPVRDRKGFNFVYSNLITIKKIRAFFV